MLTIEGNQLEHKKTLEPLGTGILEAPLCPPSEYGAVYLYAYQADSFALKFSGISL